MRRVRVTAVVERDEGMVLLAGEVIDGGQRVTFHVRGPRSAEIADRVTAGQDVEVELP